MSIIERLVDGLYLLPEQAQTPKMWIRRRMLLILFTAEGFCLLEHLDRSVHALNTCPCASECKKKGEDDAYLPEVRNRQENHLLFIKAVADQSGNIQ